MTYRTREDQAIAERALQFAREHKNSIAGKLTNLGIYIGEDEPVSVFMAGSPGAGKTEASKALLETLENETHRIVRVDPDDLRSEFEEYTGSNSTLFQSAVSILVIA